MALYRIQKFVCVVILGLLIFGAVQAAALHLQQSVKKELQQETNNPTSLQTQQDANAGQHNNGPDENVEVVKSSNVENKNTNELKVVREGDPPQQPQEGKTGIIINTTPEGSKVSTQSSSLSVTPSPQLSSTSQSVFYHPDETILGSNEEISDSLKTGFFFFAALSLSAIVFIVFKVYRLRLSRAERKYGVQGDRSTQELTPLPITIEDGHSDDDEDHTLFEVHRQNIRIL